MYLTTLEVKDPKKSVSWSVCSGYRNFDSFNSCWRFFGPTGMTEKERERRTTMVNSREVKYYDFDRRDVWQQVLPQEQTTSAQFCPHSDM
jgi:hypothetical protein